MANWIATLDLKDLWSDLIDDKTTVQAASAEIAKRIRAMTPYQSSSVEAERVTVACHFDDVAEDEYADTVEFDDAMMALYNWADRSTGPARKVAWVATAF